MAIKFYEPTVNAPPPTNGQIALSPPNLDDGQTGETWIVSGDIPQASKIEYNDPFGGSYTFWKFKTVEVGSDTVAVFYDEENYQGQEIYETGKSETLNSFQTFQSMKIYETRQYIVRTNQRFNCDVSGIDLSNLDLSDGTFSQSDFMGANPANTIFDRASLDRTDFSGSDTQMAGTQFVDSLLDLASFASTDLPQANFQSTNGLVLDDPADRPDLTGATLDVDTFWPSDWRLLDLTKATIDRVKDVILSTVDQPLDLSGAILSGVDFSDTVLDGAILDGAQLSGSFWNFASLKRASFRNAVLQGAQLNSANLDGADLCSAFLNESEDTKVSARLVGAFLRNVNLYSADLTGAVLTDAYLFSTGSTGFCATTCGFTKICASLVGAKLKNADFTGAYLTGVDFNQSTPQNAKFIGANLAGSNFSTATLSEGAETGAVVEFTGAALQRTNFGDADVTAAIFGGAFVDRTQATDSQGQALVVQLDLSKMNFPGYEPSTGSDLGCAQFTTQEGTTVPRTDTTNTCPDGHKGSCSPQQWQAITPPLPATCAVDFNWIFVTY